MCGECETFGEFQVGQVCPSGLIIMPAGDSTTQGTSLAAVYDVPGAYRTQLWECFNKAGLNQSFVGSQSSGPSYLTDPLHEGHSGFTVALWTAGDYLTANPANLVIVFLGINNAAAGGASMTNFAADYAAMLDYCRASALTPSVLAVNIPLATNAYETNYQICNGHIATAVAARAPWCHLVDMRDVSAMWNTDYAPTTLPSPNDYACYCPDQIHPRDFGYRMMAEQIFRTMRLLPNLGNE